MWMILKQKISDELFTCNIKINIFITAKIIKIKNEINNNFIVKIEKIKIYISSFSLKMNRFLALLNIITNKLNEAKKTLE